MNDPQNTAGTAGRKPRLRTILMSIAGALALAIGGMTLSTTAYSGHKGKDGKAGSSVEQKIDLMLDKVEATDDQRSRVQAIVKDAVAELKKDKQSQGNAWQDFAAALTKGSIDRDALEALRRNKGGGRRPQEPAHARRAHRSGRGADPRPAGETCRRAGNGASGRTSRRASGRTSRGIGGSEFHRDSRARRERRGGGALRPRSPLLGLARSGYEAQHP